MAKKVKLVKKTGSTLYDCYPKTTADIVMMDDDTSVYQAITDLQSELSELKAKLYLDSIYMDDGNGSLLNDGDGNNLVAVY